MRCWHYLGCVALLALGSSTQAEYRVALIIANSDYPGAKLATPSQDARAIASTLASHGFTTTIREDVKGGDLRSTFESFAERTPINGTALVYLAGYAMRGEQKGEKDNYLLPVDRNPRQANAVAHKNYGVRDILNLLCSQGSAATHIVILDGSYAHPVAGASLAPTEVSDLPADSLVLYGVAAGKTVAPGDRLSPFAAQFSDLKSFSVESLTSLAGYSKSTLAKGVTLSGPASRAIAPRDKFQPGKKAGDQWVNGRGMVMIWCPPGKFTMGSPKGMKGRQEDEGPVEVVIPEGFYLSQFELTRSKCVRKQNRALGSHRNHPANSIHWDDIARDLRELNKTERAAGRLPRDWEYALPDEAHWEYAARAGTSTRFYFGDQVENLPRHANFADRTLYEQTDGYHDYADRKLNDGVARLAVVGRYKPNPWGFHDMYGNVWEWCDTRYLPSHPTGPIPFKVDKKNRGNPVIRGGSYVSLPSYCRSAFRHHWSVRSEQDFIGFRYVLRKRRPGSRYSK